jgi:hypothetical protein
MHAIGARAPRDVEHARHVEVALGRRPGAERVRLVGHEHVERGAVGLAEHRDRRDALLAQRADHAHGDLAAVRDEHAAELRHPQPSSTTHATATPASCAIVRWERWQPSDWKNSSATPWNWSCGWRPPGWITSACFQPTPADSPVPIALNAASFAANRAARWGSGSLLPAAVGQLGVREDPRLEPRAEPLERPRDPVHLHDVDPDATNGHASLQSARIKRARTLGSALGGGQEGRLPP